MFLFLNFWLGETRCCHFFRASWPPAHIFTTFWDPPFYLAPIRAYKTGSKRKLLSTLCGWSGELIKTKERSRRDRANRQKGKKGEGEWGPIQVLQIFNTAHKRHKSHAVPMKCAGSCVELSSCVSKLGLGQEWPKPKLIFIHRTIWKIRFSQGTI